ncbi:hypothetical protein KM043_016138 [Ampulex compressa]|nr:hypothetical protein KM043_016138 [Ampulex compressa]
MGSAFECKTRFGSTVRKIVACIPRAEKKRLPRDQDKRLLRDEEQSGTDLGTDGSKIPRQGIQMGSGLTRHVLTGRVEGRTSGFCDPREILSRRIALLSAAERKIYSIPRTGCTILRKLEDKNVALKASRTSEERQTCFQVKCLQNDCRF